MLKTYANWKGNLSEYLNIGDRVDEEMVNYFIDVLPPACYRKDCIQIGEPYSHTKEGKPTYSTLKGTSEGYEWAGHCLRGETLARKDDIPRI